MTDFAQYRKHPWHGASLGNEAPDVVTAYIEIVPTDTVKYEIDKDTGILKIDRPQQFSSMAPMLYGFLPQTYCGIEIANFCMQQTGLAGIVGDGDPLDILVLTEHHIPHGDILVTAIPIGGLRMIDHGEADDKIIAVLSQDAAFGHFRQLSELPEGILQRLRHYFLTYKQHPQHPKRTVQIAATYDALEAHQVIRAATRDYLRLLSAQTSY